MVMQHDEFSSLTHQTEVPRSPRSEKCKRASSLQWRSIGNKTNKQLANLFCIHICLAHVCYVTNRIALSVLPQFVLQHQRCYRELQYLLCERHCECSVRPRSAEYTDIKTTSCKTAFKHRNSRLWAENKIQETMNLQVSSWRRDLYWSNDMITWKQGSNYKLIIIMQVKIPHLVIKKLNFEQVILYLNRVFSQPYLRSAFLQE